MSPEVGQHLSNVVAAAAKHGEEGVADCAFECGSGLAVVGFHVTDFGFDGAAAAKIGYELWCQAASCAAEAILSALYKTELT